VTGILDAPFEIRNDEDLPIRCDLRTPSGPGPFPVVVVVHGFKGFKDWGMFPPTARFLAEQGVATVAMNTSKNGIGEKLDEFTELELFATNTPAREVADVRRVVDAIAAGELGGELDASRVGLLGHSRGGGVIVLHAAADARVECLVTWGSIATFHRHTQRAIESWREEGRLEIPNLRTGQILWHDVAVLDDLERRRADYDIETAARGVTVPFLAIHGAQDEAVDSGDSERLITWAGSAEKRLHILESTGHTFGCMHPWAGPTPAWTVAVEETAAWFRAWLGAGRV